jgi:hypothetical protein
MTPPPLAAYLDRLDRLARDDNASSANSDRHGEGFPGCDAQ